MHCELLACRLGTYRLDKNSSACLLTFLDAWLAPPRPDLPCPTNPKELTIGVLRITSSTTRSPKSLILDEGRLIFVTPRYTYPSSVEMSQDSIIMLHLLPEGFCWHRTYASNPSEMALARVNSQITKYKEVGTDDGTSFWGNLRGKGHNAEIAGPGSCVMICSCLILSNDCNFAFHLLHAPPHLDKGRPLDGLHNSGKVLENR